MSKPKISDWVQHLPEVGSPIRERAQNIDGHFEQAKALKIAACKASRDLEKDIQELWTYSEIHQAKCAARGVFLPPPIKTEVKEWVHATGEVRKTWTVYVGQEVLLSFKTLEGLDAWARHNPQYAVKVPFDGNQERNA